MNKRNVLRIPDTAIWRIRVKRQVKTPKLQKSVLFTNFDFFHVHPPNTKRSTVKAFPEVSLVSITVRSQPVIKNF